MFCDVCGERSAVVFLTRIINGQKSEANLCETCAKHYKDELKINFGEFSFENFWSGLAGANPLNLDLLNINKTAEVRSEDATNNDACPTCGASYEDFRRTGLISCWNCYQQFADRLEPTLKRIHGNVSHQGKKLTEKENELDRLRAELREKVQLEEYEQAVVLRDQIKELELQTSD